LPAAPQDRVGHNNRTDQQPGPRRKKTRTTLVGDELTSEGGLTGGLRSGLRSGLRGGLRSGLRGGLRGGLRSRLRGGLTGGLPGAFGIIWPINVARLINVAWLISVIGFAWLISVFSIAWPINVAWLISVFGIAWLVRVGLTRALAALASAGARVRGAVVGGVSHAGHEDEHHRGQQRYEHFHFLCEHFSYLLFASGRIIQAKLSHAKRGGALWFAKDTS
jgi:hypothetical protein